jgi:hypothetical protein
VEWREASCYALHYVSIGLSKTAQGTSNVANILANIYLPEILKSSDLSSLNTVFSAVLGPDNGIHRPMLYQLSYAHHLSFEQV